MRVTFHQKRSSFCVVLKTWGEQEEFSSVKVIIPQGGKRLWEKFCDFDFAKSFDVVDSGKKDLRKNLSRKVLSIFFKQES